MYSEKFERDYNWYLKYKDIFTFDGHYNKEIKEDYNYGLSAKECFYKFDTNGIMLNTKEPKLLSKIFKCKGSINFNIKMWAEDRAKGYLPKIEFIKIINEFELLDWMVDAVEKQKCKYY